MKARGVVSILIFVAVVAGAAWLLQRKHSETHSVSGTVEVDAVRVASRYGGRVEKILAQEGEPLKAGQIIVELEASELKAKRDLAAAQLDELQKGPRAEEIAAAKHEWESLKVELAFAQTEKERFVKLFEQKVVNESERDRAEAQANVLEARAAAAGKRYDVLVAGTRPEKITQAEAQLAEVEVQLREMHVTAPSDCLLEVLSVKVGDVLRPNQEVATLLLTQHLWVRVYVPELWLGHIKLGEQVKVLADSISDREFVGAVEQINRQAEFTPRNVQTAEDRSKQVFGVKVRLPSDSPLRAGMSVDVSFPDVPEKPK